MRVLDQADAQDGRWYILDTEGLNECVQTTLAQASVQGQSQNASYIIGNLLHSMAEKYPDAHLLTDYTDTSEWVFNNAGGAMGSMYIIHASLTE